MPSPSSLTTGQRLALGFGLVLALIIGITAFGIQKVNLIDHTLTEITDVNAVKQRYANNFRGSVHDRAISLRDVTLVPDAAGLTAALQAEAWGRCGDRLIQPAVPSLVASGNQSHRKSCNAP